MKRTAPFGERPHAPRCASFGIACLLFTAFFATVQAFAQQPSAPAQTETPRQLSYPAPPIVDHMRGGEKRDYTIALKADTYVEIVAEQKGIDVVLYLYDSHGNLVLKIDGVTGAEGPENLPYIAKADGQYRLEILPNEKDAKPGAYELGIIALHPATERDRKRARALASLAEAIFARDDDKEGSEELSLSKYQESLGLLREIGDTYHEQFAVDGVCRQLVWTGNAADAVPTCQIAFDDVQKSGDKRSIADAAYHLGVALGSSAHPGDAIPLLQKAADLYRELQLPAGEATTLASLGILQLHSGEPQKALIALTRELELRNNLDTDREKSICLNRMGLAYHDLDDKLETQKSYSAAIEAARHGHAVPQEALALHNRGLMYLENGQKADAAADFKLAAPLYHKAGGPQDEISVYLSLADALNDSAKPNASSGEKRAIQTERDAAVDKALALARDKKLYHEQALALRKKGTLLYMLTPDLDDNRAEAEKHKLRLTKRDALVESQKLMHEYGKPGEEPEIWAQLGALDRDLGNAKQSVLDYRNAISLYHQTGDSKAEADTLAKLAIASFRAKEYNESLQNYRELELLWSAQGNLPQTLQAVIDQGAAELSLEQTADAMRLFNRAVSECLATIEGCVSTQASAHRFLGLTYLKNGDREKALADFNADFVLMKKEDAGVVAFLKKIHADLIWDPELSVRQGEILAQDALPSLDAVWDRLAFTSFVGWEEDSHFVQVAEQIAEQLGIPQLKDCVILGTVMQLQMELAIANEHLKALLKQNEALQTALDERKGLKPKPKNNQDLDDKARADQLELEGESAMRRDSLQQAVATLQQALALRRKVGNIIEIARTLTVLGEAWLNLNDGQQSLAAYQEAREKLHAAAQPKEELEALLGLGIASNWLGRREQALAAYQEAVDLARESQLQEQEAAALYRIGETYLLLGQKRDALSNLLAARDQSTPIGLIKREESYAQILSLIGLTYASLGDKAHAAEFYKNAAFEFERGLKENLLFLNLRAKSREYNQLGEAYAALGETQNALETFRQGLIIQRNFGSLSEQTYALGRIGELLLALGGAEKAKLAIASLQDALEMSRKNGNPLRQGEVLHDLGMAYEQAGDSKTALNYFDQSLAVRYRIHDLDGEGETLDRLMRLWRGMRHPALAAFYGKQAVNAYQQIRVNMQGIGDDLQKSYLHSHYGTYRELADVLIVQGRIPEAQQVLDLLKNEEYLDFVRRDASDFSTGMASTTPPEAATWQSYQQIQDHILLVARRYAELSAKEALTAREKTEFARTEKELTAANLSFDTFLTRLPNEFHVPAEGEEQAERVREGKGLQETIRELGPGTIALYTVVTEDRYHIIVFGPDTQKDFTYEISAADLDRKVQKFRLVLRDPRYDPAPIAQEMYKILVAPAQQALDEAGAKTLMWSLDGPLRYVPVAALHDGHHYLVERYNLTIFTPASHSRLERPTAEKWRGLGLGVSKGTNPLPNVPDELRGVIRDDQDAASQQGVVTGKILLDEAFTKQAMKEALQHGKGYSLVHVASHFRFKPGNDYDTYLLLGGTEQDSSDSRHWSLAELKSGPNIFHGVELLTLSACNTAIGTGQGSEVENFAVLAQLKGARAVIATLWPVADESTMRLMQDFYRHHNEHPEFPKIEDLRQAQLDMLHGCPIGGCGKPVPGTKKRTDADDDAEDTIDAPLYEQDPRAPFSHPYFWAPFVLVGNWR
jgi:CHAT domain-containing protein/tetratricopeptide (TPR) repeat protein